MTEFLMPKLGADMTAGTLVSWHKQVGDAVHRGDVVAEVDTEKGIIDVEIFTDGVLEKLLAQPGQRVPVGAPLAFIRESANGAMSPPPDAPAKTVVEPSATVSAGAPTVPRESLTMESPAALPARASALARRSSVGPAARWRARQLGIDPATVVGASVGGTFLILNNGTVVSDGVPLAQEQKQGQVIDASRPQALTPSEDRAARMRQAIAAAMSRSKREIPHYYLGMSIDMDRSLKWLAEQNARRPVTERILSGALVLKAVALALRKYPELNSVWENDRAVVQPDVHVGVAISLKQGGLIAPAIRHADQLTLNELMVVFRELANRTRSGTLKSSEISDPTTTVTNLGEQGVETVFGVIYPPQTSLFGVGKIIERPWAVNGRVVVRPIMAMSLSGDHRATDVHYGGLALNEIDRLLQKPEML